MAGINRSTRHRRPLLAALAILAMLPGAAAMARAQDGSTSSTTKDAKQIATQPVRDVGIEKTKTPPLLIEVSKQPYSNRGTANCRQLASGIDALNEVLGPDYLEPAPARKRNLAKAGGSAVVNSLIPFRGLVREVSGAAPAERRRDAAIDAGIARRGYLRGIQKSRKCRLN